MRCDNGDPPCRGEAAGGYNPLGLCAGCLAAYRAKLVPQRSPPAHTIGFFELAPNPSEPAARVSIRVCPLGCRARCERATTRRKGEWTHVIPAKGDTCQLTSVSGKRS